jgi:hypothetical protein
MYMNQLTIIGFTGQDAEFHYTPNRTPVATISSWPRCGGWSKGYRSERRRGRWRSTLTCCIVGGGSSARGWATSFRGNGKQRWSGRPDCGLRTESGPADAGNRFFERVLAAHRGTADAAGTKWRSAVYRKVQEEVKAARGLTIGRMVELGGVSRASFYRFGEDSQPGTDPDMDLRDAIQRIALEWPSYGRLAIYCLSSWPCNSILDTTNYLSN